MHSVAGPGAAMYGASRTPMSAAGVPAPAALTASSQDLAPVPAGERVAASEYDSFLSHLKFNSKEIINNLTKIAGENVKSAHGIAFVVERRIVNSAPAEKLPYLYLLDSIVKNIGGVYVRRFSQNLYNVFRNVFSVSPPATRASMHRLLNTWPPIFGHELVTALRRAAVECDSAPQLRPGGPGGIQLPVSSVQTHSRIPRVPLSDPAAAPGRYHIPKISNHPGRNRSIVQVPIPKRQTAVQMGHTPQQPLEAGVSMGMGLNGGASHMRQSSVPGSMGMPMHGMHGVYGIQGSQGVQQMVQPGVHGGQGLPHQGVQGIHSAQGIQGIHGLQGMQPIQPAYGMPPPQQHMHAQTGLAGQVQGLHQGIAVSSHIPTATNFVGGVSAGAGGTGVLTERQRETQRLMAEITRKSAIGIGVTNEEYAGINSFIDVQLRSAPSHSERELLLALQQQLRASYSATPVASQRQAGMAHPQSVIQAGSAPPQQQISQQISPQIPPYLSASMAPSQPPVVVPALNSNSLSNLMRSLPELARSAQAVQRQEQAEQAQAQVQQHSHVARHDPRGVHAGGPVSMQPVAMQIPSHTPMPFSAIRTTSHTAFVREIYTDLPHLSKSDGMRFATKEELRAHLDWLFARNRRKRARDQNLSSARISRCWFDAVSKFLGEKNGGGAPGSAAAAADELESSVAAGTPAQDPLNACVEARGDNERCPACCEEFVSFWDEEKQAWMLKEAMRNKNGKAFHTRCAASIPNIDEHDEFEAVEGEELPVKKEVTSATLSSVKEVNGPVPIALKQEKRDAVADIVVKREIERAIPDALPVSHVPAMEKDRTVKASVAKPALAPEEVQDNASTRETRKRPSLETDSSPAAKAEGTDTADVHATCEVGDGSRGNCKRRCDPQNGCDLRNGGNAHQRHPETDGSDERSRTKSRSHFSNRACDKPRF